MNSTSLLEMTLSRITATAGEGLDTQITDLRRLSATAVTDDRHALLVDDRAVLALADPAGRVYPLGWLGPKPPFFTGKKEDGAPALDVDLVVEGDGFFAKGTDLYFVRKAFVFLCARGGQLVVTELDRLPPDTTEIEDPGLVGLAAADLIDVYVAERGSA